MAVIDGNEAFPFYSQTTRDIYNLSDNIDQHTVDYYPGHASDSGSLPAQIVLTSTLPVETTTYTILGNTVVNTYLNDYYFRVHINPNPITLGNVLSEQNISVEVWNAYFVDNPLASIVGTGTDGLTFTNGLGLTTYAPLAYRTYNLNVKPTGTAIIDAEFAMNFSFGATSLFITGQRAILWPFAPFTDHSEQIDWLTDILPSMNGEQALNLKDTPRDSLNYKYFFRTVEEFSLAKNIAKTYQNLYLATPVWSQIREISAIASGTTVLTIDTTYMEISIGDIALIYQNYLNYEIVEILNLTATSITFKLATVTNFTTTCYFIPAKICIMPKGIDFSRAEASKNSVQATFQTTKAYMNESIAGMEIYDSLPVITTNSVIEASLSEKFTRNIEFLDNDIGDIAPIDIEIYTRHRQNIAIVAHGQKNIFTLKRLLDYFKGKYNYFYLPTFSKDCIPVTINLTTANNTVTVLNSSLVLTPPKFVRIIGDTIVNMPVLLVTSAGATETIQFTTNMTANVSNLKTIQILTKCRLDSDSLNLQYQNSKANLMTASLTAPVIEVL